MRGQTGNCERRILSRQAKNIKTRRTFLKAGGGGQLDLLPYTLHGLGGADRVPVIQEIRHLHLEVRGFKSIVASESILAYLCVHPRRKRRRTRTSRTARCSPVIDLQMCYILCR